MPHPNRVHCSRCGRHSDECGPISHGGNCVDCGVARMEEALRSISAGEGPMYVSWLRGLARAAGYRLVRELPDDEPQAASRT